MYHASASLFKLQDITRTYGPIKIPNWGYSKLKKKQLNEIYEVHHAELVVYIRCREEFGLWVCRVNVFVKMPT